MGVKCAAAVQLRTVTSAADAHGRDLGVTPAPRTNK